MKHRILVIDDSLLDLEALRLLLESHGFLVKTAQNPDDGIAFVRQNRGAISLAIVDYNMPEKNGAEVARALKDADQGIQIATYSGDNRPDVYEALEMGSEYFIQKNTAPEKVLAVVRMFCAKYERAHRTLAPEPIQESEVKEIRAAGLIGVSDHLLEVVRLVENYAPLDDTILITGENGTGKEKIARAIHIQSRLRGEFVTVNCAAIPNDLLESELFGHERGAFSGAVRDKIGLAQKAANGTLFLDEIGELPLQLQAKLLRFLQEGEVKPVGSNETIKVNSRVVLATNVKLDEAVAAGRFRQDLYYRIKGFPIHLKPLRERKEDIRPLVLQFSQNIAREKNLRREFLEETVRLLERYDWPGNVRELEHEVKRAMTLAKGPTVLPGDIHEAIRAAVTNSGSLGGFGVGLDYESFKEHQRRRNEEEERRFLLENSRRARSIRELARDFLNVSNSTLQGRLKALGVEFKPQTKEKTKGEVEYETT